VIDSINAVIISHADIEHLGALPYAYGRLGLRAPIYTTDPVFNMGQMFLYDSYLSMHACVCCCQRAVAAGCWY
jgi:cleavage and polyadenylation specificity factor subunit 2